jgi:hypothetical protein
VFLSLNRITPAPNVQRCYTPRKRAQAGLSGAVEAGNPGFRGSTISSALALVAPVTMGYWVWLRKQIPSTLRMERRRLSH